MQQRVDMSHSQALCSEEEVEISFVLWAGAGSLRLSM